MQLLRRLGITCVALAWLVPNHYFPWVSAYNEALAFLGLGLLALSLLKPRSTTQSRIPASANIVMAVALLPLLQFAWGKVLFSGDAYVSFLYVAALSMAMVVGFELAIQQPFLFAQELAWGVLAAGLASSMLALLQGLQLTPLGMWMVDCPPEFRPYANLAQPNNLATLLGWSLVGLWLLYERERLGPLAASLALALLALALGLTQSRTAFVFGPILIAVVFALRKRAALMVPVAPMVLATLLQWGVSSGWPAVQRLLLISPMESLADRGAGSVRFEMWPRLLDALWMQPWTGFGWLQVGAAQMLSAERHPPAKELWFHAHNLFLDLCLWVGLPLGLLLSASIVYWMVTRWRRVANVEAVCAMAALTLFGVHAMLELPHHYAYFLVPAGVWIGQVEMAVAAPARWRAWFVAAGSLAAVVAFVGIASEYVRIEDDFRTMRFEVLGVARPDPSLPRVQAPFLSSLADYVNGTRIVLRPGMSTQDMALLERLMERFPYASTLTRYATALALNGRQDEATTVMTKLRYMHGERDYDGARQHLRELGASNEAALASFERQLP